jgi:hypothetical protein
VTTINKAIGHAKLEIGLHGHQRYILVLVTWIKIVHATFQQSFTRVLTSDSIVHSIAVSTKTLYAYGIRNGIHSMKFVMHHGRASHKQLRRQSGCSATRSRKGPKSRKPQLVGDAITIVRQLAWIEKF